MMVDRCAYILEFAPYRRLGHQHLLGLAGPPILFSSHRAILIASPAVDVRERVRLPEIRKREHPLLGFLGTRVLGRHVRQVGVENI